jgi:hypothetical protein
MLVKTFYPYDDTFSKDLCVLPNDGESQYEAFQSIFAVIMSAALKSSKKKNKPISPYEMLCKKFKITLIPSTHTPDIVGPGKRIIWYLPEAETHYIANVDGIQYDPYNQLQAINTQGFCQMFAFILAIGDVDGFIPADQSKKINETNFNILAHNTQLCCTKSLLYLESNSEIQEQFEKDFARLMNNERVERGIKEGTTLTQYLNDFKTINEHLACVKAYIYDQPLYGHKDGKPRPDLWFLPDTPPPNFSEEPASFDYVEANNTMDMDGGKRKTRRKKRKSTT